MSEEKVGFPYPMTAPEAAAEITRLRSERDEAQHDARRFRAMLEERDTLLGAAMRANDELVAALSRLYSFANRSRPTWMNDGDGEAELNAVRSLLARVKGE